MCGRYASTRDALDLAAEFAVRPDAVDPPLEPDWNVAPTKGVYAVLERPPREDRSAAAYRQLRVARWGLVPSWAKDPRVGSKMINARLETLAERPAYRRALAARRCLLPADGYYEWYGRPGAKQPFYLHPRDGRPLAMAGLYELWRDPADGQWLLTTTVVTTRAEDALGHLHDRMPMLVAPEGWAAWLDPRRPAPEDLHELLVPAAPGLLDATPVSTLVNHVGNNGPELVQPVPAEPPTGAATDDPR